MSKTTKFFRIATEGMALNGEEITTEMITQMAANYNPVKYTANINVEHIRGFSLGNSGFPTLGKVLALEARNFKDVDGVTKLGLYSQIEAYQPLIQAHEEKQKLGWSIEPRKFPDNGEYNLFGLAATDSPASLYTEVMAFNMRKNDDKALLYSAYLESEFEFEPELVAQKESLKPSFFSQFFGKNQPVVQPSAERRATETFELPEELTTELQKFASAFAGLHAKVESLATENSALKVALSDLTQKFSHYESTPANGEKHPSVNNSDPIILADC